MEPIFESQTKTKLGSTEMGGGLPTVRTYINDFLKTQLDNYLHKNSTVAESIQKKIQQAEKERKELSGIRKLARDRAKKASLHNKKLRDCRVHLGDIKKETHLETTLFITEGDSASGSITKSRDVGTQAVFSLRGKPLNSFGLSKKVVYENEEFNLLQSALNIEQGIDDLTESTKELSKEQQNKAKLNIDKYFLLVGISERYNQTLLLLKNILGWELPFYSIANISKNKLNNSNQGYLTEIKNINKLDIEFYEEINRDFANKINTFPNFNKELKSFEKINKIIGNLMVYQRLKRLLYRNIKSVLYR